MADGRDVIADMQRIGRALGMAREPLRLTIGSPEVWADLIKDARIPLDKYEPPPGEPLAPLMGIPIVLDATLPENMIRIGDRLLIRRDPNTWLILDLDAVTKAVLGERPDT